MARNRQVLIDQIEKVIHTAITSKVKRGGKDTACSGLVLQTVDGVGKREAIETRGLAGNEDTETIAEVFVGIAESWASGDDDKVKFEIGFFYGDEKPHKPYQFFVTGQAALGVHGVEEATAKSILKSVQSDAREAIRMAFEQTNAMAAMSIEMVAAATSNMKQLHDKLDMTEKEREAAINILLAMRAQQESKEHEYRMEEIQRQHDNDIKMKALEYGPAILNGLAGKPVLPESMGDTALVKMLLGALDKIPKDLLQQLVMHLPPEVQLPMTQRGMQLREEAKAQTERKAKAIEDAGQVVRRPETVVDVDKRGLTQ
jgi:hypothetical protein